MTDAPRTDTDEPYQPEFGGQRAESHDGDTDDSDGPVADDEAVGVPVPDDHVGAFVAQAFEDPERSTEWGDVVSAMIAPSARDAWESLSPVEQAVEVLRKAAEYDRRATDALERVPTNAGTADPEIRQAFDDAKRLRRNADTFRDGIAAAYRDGRLDDDTLVEAVERAEFDTGVIAEREDALERVTSVYDLDYRPYGGTMFDTEENDHPDRDSDIPETF